MGQPGRAGTAGDITRIDVLRAGRRAFLRQERIDVVALATDLGIARATVYRWFGDRNHFTGAVLASLALDTLEGALSRCETTGVALVADALAQTLDEIMAHPGMKAFLAADPRRALTILTGPDSAVHEGLVARMTGLVDEHCPPSPGEALCSGDIAYALVRLAEAFCYTDITTGRPSEVRRAHPLFVRILEG